MPKASPKYKRIVLKLSGEAVARKGHFGIDEEALAAAAQEIKPLLEHGVQVAIVMGGGNFFRGRQLEGSQRIARTTADMIGMLATTMNGLALRDCLEASGMPARLMGTVTTPTVCEPYIARKAIDHLEHNRAVILAGGTGSPYFTTDTAAALRAAEVGAALLKATKVDGVFSADPEKDPDAQRFSKLMYHDVLKQRLGVMDLTAVSLCMEAHVPILVFKFTTPGNTLAAVMGKDVGTTIE